MGSVNTQECTHVHMGSVNTQECTHVHMVYHFCGVSVSEESVDFYDIG
jgi:hypothetical protein